jgi:large subunit ribosomal protein L15
MGWGQVGQHRKSGGRGGKGKAGGRKHFWIRTVKYEKDRYKNIGFKPPSAKKQKHDIINVGELEDIARRLNNKNIFKAGNELDLSSIGIRKILGKGRINIPLNIRVSEITILAREKIEKAGGSITET